MTLRERFLGVMEYRKVDRIPDWDFGYWDETIEEWHSQGLPKECRNHADVERFVGLEGTALLPTLPLRIGLFPSFKREVLEEKAHTIVFRDGSGVVCEQNRGPHSIPRYLEYPIRDRETWKRFRDEHLDPDHPDRIPRDFAERAKKMAAGDAPVRVRPTSLYGDLRCWMGVENISVAIMLERDWVEEMMEHMCALSLRVLEKALPQAKVDLAWWWEDMCFSNGPLISPELFETLMVPRYRRITDLLAKHGVRINLLDCDGQIYKLVPGWLRAGINCMFPIEAAPTDPLELRRRYGRECLLVGGVNKHRLAEGKDAIRRDLDRLAPLMEEGGYIPTVDHRVQPGVTFENYRFYLEERRKLLARGTNPKST